MASYGRPINGPSDVLLDHGEGRTAALSFRSTPNPRPRFECRCGRRCATGEGRPPVTGLLVRSCSLGVGRGAGSCQLPIAYVPLLFLPVTRRTIPEAKTDDAAFPVRVRFHVGPHGLGRTAAALHAWLDDQIGRGNYAVHGGGRAVGGDCVSLYFRTPADAVAWPAAFPQLELADGTRLPGYHSPYLPFGRPPVEDESVCNL